MTNLGNLRRAIRKRYRQVRKWQVVADEFGITVGMAWRLANEPGYEPRGARIRLRLGLPAMVEVAACAVCGEVHTKPHPQPLSETERGARRWFDLPKWVLKWAFENREEVPGGK